VSGDATTASFGLLSVFAMPDVSVGAFTAPLTAGGTIDVGAMGFEIAFNKATGFN